MNEILVQWCNFYIFYLTNVRDADIYRIGDVMVSVLASSAFGSKPKTIKLVFAASLLSTQF